jgi:hypothetical protein
MTRTVTLLGYTVLAAAMIGHQAFGLLSGRTATLGQAVARLRRSRVGRPLLLAAWLWLGWHLFVRGTYQ